MLDTRFPRPHGDLGNPASWGVPTEVLVVTGIGPQDAVQSAAGLRHGPVLAAFSQAIRQLEQRGVDAITTSCGFLAPLQDDLQAVSSVPVVTSSLMLLPALLAKEGEVGVLTISAGRLDPVRGAIVEGMPQDGAFCRAILGNRGTMDIEAAGREVVEAALRLKSRAPHLRSLVLECTNMPPYAGRISDVTGWRVLSLLDSPVLHRALAASGTLASAS